MDVPDDSVRFLASTWADVCVYHVALVGIWGHWNRAEALYNSWGREFIEKTPSSVFLFGSPVPGERFANMSVIVHGPEGGYRSLWYTYNEILKLYLNSTSLPWIVRTTEDCFCNVELFNQYIRRLNSQYNPNRDIVVKGQVCRLSGDPNGPMYVHGGPGWILSRAAAREWLKNLDELNRLYKFYPSFGDDVFLEYFKKMVNLTNSDIDAVEFIGPPLNPADRDMLAAGNMSFPQCADVARTKFDMRFIKTAVFWHSGDALNLQVTNGKEIQAAAPDNLIFDLAVRPVQLCYLNKSQIIL